MLNINSELKTAANLLKESCDNCNDISEEIIAKAIERHLEAIIEDALNDPESFFRDQYRFWRDLQKAQMQQERRQAA